MDVVENKRKSTADIKQYAVTFPIILLVIYLTIVPLFTLLWGSVHEGRPWELGAFSLESYVKVYGDPLFYELFINSLICAIGGSLLATFSGTILAVLIYRTDCIGRRWLNLLIIMYLMSPSIANISGWILLASPKIGVINKLCMEYFGHGLINLYSYGGMIFMMGMNLTPLVYLMMIGPLQQMDPALEEAGMLSGLNNLNVFRKVTLPLMLPALASANLIVFVRMLGAFEVPALLGMPAKIIVFTSGIYQALKYAPISYARASALSMTLLLISVVGILIYYKVLGKGSFATITGKGFRPRVLSMGKWRVPLGLFAIAWLGMMVILPTLTLLYSSFMPYFSVPSLSMLHQATLKNYRIIWESIAIKRAFLNSIIVSLSSATITIFITAVISWITVRTRMKGRQLLDILAFAPIGVPNLVLATALMWLYLQIPLPVYGTLWIIIIAYVTHYMPNGMRTVSACMAQIHQELEEAAAVSGASWWTTFSKVVVPLLRPGMLAGWVYIALMAMREVSASIVLVGIKSTVFPVLIFDYWSENMFGAVASSSIILIFFSTGLVGTLYMVGGSLTEKGG